MSVTVKKAFEFKKGDRVQVLNHLLVKKAEVLEIIQGMIICRIIDPPGHESEGVIIDPTRAQLELDTPENTPEFKTTLRKELEYLAVQNDQELESNERLCWDSLAIILREILRTLNVDLDREIKDDP